MRLIRSSGRRIRRPRAPEPQSVGKAIQRTARQLGQCIDLERHVLPGLTTRPASPPSHRLSTDRKIGGWVARRDGRRSDDRPRTQISCFSLFTMSKTIKVQTN